MCVVREPNAWIPGDVFLAGIHLGRFILLPSRDLVAEMRCPSSRGEAECRKVFCAHTLVSG